MNAARREDVGAVPPVLAKHARELQEAKRDLEAVHVLLEAGRIADAIVTIGESVARLEGEIERAMEDKS